MDGERGTQLWKPAPTERPSRFQGLPTSTTRGLGIFKERYNAGRPAAKFLSDQAFGVYVFRAPVLIPIATTASFAVSLAIRRVGFLRKDFS
jgi:hypothetical protein